MSSSYFKRNRWPCAVFITVIVCGILIYGSCIYLKNNEKNCVDCENHSLPKSEHLTQTKCRNNVCTTTECVHAASFILQTMNQSADPCEDFYSFSCGNWLKEFSENDSYSVVRSMQREIFVRLKDLLENAKGSAGSTTEKLKMVYNSCMSENFSKSNGVQMARDVLNHFGFPMWPILTEDFEFTHSLDETLALLASYRQFAFIRFYGSDESSNDSLIFKIDWGRTLLGDPSANTTYANFVFYILRHFGLDDQTAAKLWEEFKTIETTLINLFVNSYDKGYTEDGETIAVVPIDCTTEATNDTTTKVFACNILRHFVEFSEVANIYSKDRVQISTTFLSEDVFSVLSNFSHRMLGNYLGLRFIIKEVDNLGTSFRIAFSLHVDQKEMEPNTVIYIQNWKHCVNWIMQHMPYGLAQEYVQNTLSPGKIKEMNDIMADYVQETVSYVEKQTWITEDLREKLRSSIGNVTNKLEKDIEKLLNGSISNLPIHKFQPTNQSFLRNVVEYHRRDHISTFLSTQTWGDDDFAGIFAVNAYNSPGIIALKFGVFLPPTYEYRLPKLLNLLNMGSIIGHEMGHEISAFIAESENFDNDTMEILDKKKKCLEDQYSEFEIKKLGKKVKGNETVHENLADLIGIELIPQVINKFIGKNDDSLNLRLPGLNFNLQQTFYISMAQMWCFASNYNHSLLMYEKDIHAPPDFRVIGKLQNLPEFSDAFSCPPGSYMNPVQKCTFRENN